LMRLRSGPRMVARIIALMNAGLSTSVSFFTQKTRLVSEDLSSSNWYGCSSLNGDIVTSLESLRREDQGCGVFAEGRAAELFDRRRTEQVKGGGVRGARNHALQSE
jgi:hypothetical protein